MNRKEEIEQAAQRYIHTEHYTDWNIRTDAFKAGAKYADNHPQSPWHSVADGDEPEHLSRSIEPDFIVKTTAGRMLLANYFDGMGIGCHFEDNSDNILDDVAYWMEIPQLPKESDKGKQVFRKTKAPHS